jgi:SET domain-containing protein
MTGMEGIAIATVTKAIDFLFGEAVKLMDERRQQRKARGESVVERPSTGNAIDKKEVLNKTSKVDPKTLFLRDYPKEIEHCIEQIHKLRNNKRMLEDQVNNYGGFSFAPLITQNQIRLTEDEIERWIIRLRTIVEDVYGHKLEIAGID